MSLSLVSPTRLSIEGHDKKMLDLQLQYHDKRVDNELQRAKNNRWLYQELGPEKYAELITDLKAQRVKSLLFEDEKGMWTYSGMARRLQSALNVKVNDQRTWPEAKNLPWANVPEKEARPYQEKARDALLAVKHGAVEMGTGLGKSYIIQLVLKELGLPAVIMAPSTNIATQLYEDFIQHFGRARVGMYGDGKKDFKKMFTVGIKDSLTKIEPGSDAWNVLSKKPIFIADESHQTPADTLQRVCFGLMKDAPYRYFFSGTQMRTDGLELVLEAITGEIVYRMTVKEGVDQGYLSRPYFTMVEVESDDTYFSKDPLKMQKAHLYYNQKVLKAAADIANKSITLMNRPTLILVEEFEQFAALLPHLRHKVAFAHGGVNKDNAKKIPKMYHESDPSQLVKDFNDGQLQLLVGTSCVSTGTDIRAVKHIIYLMGGLSEIKVKQAVGRGTRLFPGKTDCLFTDFNVSNVEVTKRHAKARRAIYNDIYGPVREISYGH